MQEQWDWVAKEFSMPEELLQSVLYLQRALRDCVMQHQVLASKINILAMHQRPKVKQYMLELEREILSIGREQEGVVRQLSERVKRFQMMVQSQRNVSVPEDIVCGFVSRHLAAQGDSNETAPAAYVPKHISPRWSAADLAQKFGLETLLGHDDGTLKQQPEDEAERRDLIHTDNAQWDTALSIAVAKKKNKLSSNTITKTYTKSFVTAQSSSRTGSKSKASSSTEERPFAGIANQKLTYASAKKEIKHQDEDSEADEEEEEEEEEEDEEDGQDQTPEKSSEDEPEQERKPTAKRGVWMPGTRGRPPKGSKYVSAAKQALIEAKRLSAMQRPKPAIIQRRASKRKEVLSEKVEDPVEMDESGEEESPPTELLNSAAVRRGRSNLLQALNKQKRGPGRPSLESLGIQKVAKRAVAPTPGGSKLVKHASYASSGSSPNSRSSTPTWGGPRNPSEDSSDRRSSPSAEFPPLPEPGEPAEPSQPLSISDMDQTTFLRYFRVYPPEEVKAMKERKSERKRRSCYSTERKDFHYGKLDYYEQQQQFQAARASTSTKRTHQRPILYSPPVAAAKRRKPVLVAPPPPPPPPHPPARYQSAAGAGSAVRSSIVRPRVQPLNIFAAMDKRACFVCSKSGTTDELGACMNCCNIYHLSCHTVDEQSEAYRHRDDLCPVCLPDTENGSNQSELED